MVRKWSIILFFIILYSCNVAFAAKFTASVDRAEVSIDEDLQLNITLSDAILTETINADFLLKDFYILGNSKLQNGIKNTDFYLSLQPKKVGKITIPAFTAITSAGKLTTEAITINVIKSQTIKADKGSVANISIDSYISKENPYKHESITYIAEVVSDKDFQFIPEKLEIKDTIVEAAVPHPSTEVRKGVKYYIYKCKYIITPLKSGKITIPPLKIKGNYYVKNQKKQRNIINSKNFAVFSIIDHQRMFSDVKSIPFALVSNEVTFNVKPPVSGINPWLPAKSLTIKEYIDESQLKEGEPIIRMIRIDTIGLAANQIPEIEIQELQNEDFKIYKEQPQTATDLKQGFIQSEKVETHTIIPKKSGKITLPEIKIAWWNVEKDQLDYAILPSKTINNNNQQQENFIDSKKQETAKSLYHKILYSAAGIIISCLIIAIILSFRQKNQGGIKKKGKFSFFNNFTTKQQQIVTKLTDLKKANSVEELNKFIQEYAGNNMKIAQYSSLRKIFAKLSNDDNVDYNELISQIEGALYANKTINLNLVKSNLLKLLKNYEKNCQRKVKINDKLIELNPS